MNRYYILTEREGLRVLGAAAVDESIPFLIRFLGDTGTESFDRHELLWWGAVESSPAAPFSDFGPDPFADSRRSAKPPSPWDAHEVWAHQAKRNADDGRRLAATLRAQRSLVEALRGSVPADWKKAVVELKVSYQLPECRYKVMHRILNPDTGAEAFDFSDALIASIEVFHRISVERRECWNRSTLAVRLDNGAADVSYEYGTNFGPR